MGWLVTIYWGGRILFDSLGRVHFLGMFLSMFCQSQVGFPPDIILVRDIIEFWHSIDSCCKLVDIVLSPNTALVV